MFKKAFNESGRKILKVIKKLSTRSRAVKKSQQKQDEVYHNKVICELAPPPTPTPTLMWTTTYFEPDIASLSWSLPSLDAKSVDTYMTYVIENIDECNSMCCYCIEHENQRNENRENEMNY